MPPASRVSPINSHTSSSLGVAGETRAMNIIMQQRHRTIPQLYKSAQKGKPGDVDSQKLQQQERRRR
jgi:hypothetical protein